ncbi:MAG: tetratricopeptide repeat protein [Acidobacteria bacterium]|nr:tetratricopeptide repeat protein [Acidobacteriota bacterium]
MTSQATAEDEIDRAFARLYNFDFDGAHAILNRHITAHPADPFGYSVRAAVYLFWELNRLGILEGQFFIDDKRISEKKKLKLDPEVRRQFLQAIEDAQSRSEKILALRPDDENALHALCMTHSMIVDYVALIEKRQIASLSLAKRSNGCAQKLLKLHPDACDARVTTGFTEYLAGSLPFFVRWLIHFDDVKGSKEVGIQNLELVARSGHYLKPFAKILLAIVYLREKKPREAEKQLAELARDFPENPLIRKELARLSSRSPGGSVSAP